jgi:superfamily I DNA/RNA helicase
MIFITGHAGTGKTRLLLERAAVHAPELVNTDQHRILALSFMHGSRQKLEDNLASHSECKRFRRAVMTIDSFALKLVNQYRTSLGYYHPVAASAACDVGPRYQHKRTYLNFDAVVADATRLLEFSAIRAGVANSYPLVLIDEFQDCVGVRLEFVKALVRCAKVLLAADPFQFLDLRGDECPATSWVAGDGNSLTEVHELKKVWRTDDQSILNAAEALRQNRLAAFPSIPVLSGAPPMLANKIIQRLLGWYGPRWTGTTAIISPSLGGSVDSVLESMKTQLERKGIKAIRWRKHITSEEEAKRLLSELALEPRQSSSKGDDLLTARLQDIKASASRYARLRGLGNADDELLKTFVDKAVSASRAYNVSGAKLTISTVHGAKNRDFDNVFIVWPYKLPPSIELRRRLLYNAVTRAKKNCIVFDTRIKKGTTPCPVIALLGASQPIFLPKPKAGKKT